MDIQFEFIQSSEIVVCNHVYRRSDYAIDYIMEYTVRDDLEKIGYAHISISTLQLNVSLRYGRVYAADGYFPLGYWEDGRVNPPEYVDGKLYASPIGNDFIPYVGHGVAKADDIFALYDKSSGWLYIGYHGQSPLPLYYRIAQDLCVGIVDSRFHSLYINPEFRD